MPFLYQLTKNVIKYVDAANAYGGDRPQRGIMWGKPPPTRFYMGETAPNAVLCGGTRTQSSIRRGY